MSARGRMGLLCLCLGLALLVGALALSQNNRREALEAEIASREVMEKLAAAIETGREQPTAGAEESSAPETAPEAADAPPAEALPPEARPMESVRVEDCRYIGFLTVPALELELPVMEDYDEERMKIAPCRYSGSLAGGDLVIAAHNYQRHFGGLMRLPVGSEVVFTDVTGESTRFTVAELEQLKEEETERMIAGEYDLTLFTCTYSGATRYTVRCLRSDGP